MNAHAQQPPAAAPQAAASTPRVTLADVEQASQRIKDDPLLGGMEKRKQLRFKPDKDEKKKPDRPKPNTWLFDFAAWLADAGRLLAWLVGTVVLAIGVVVGFRLWSRRPAAEAALPPPPSHIGSLDIRPESLPEAIGPAAKALWQAGEGRAALALLYRAALSRLVHVHRVPVRSASTEQECLALAQPVLPAASADYLRDLVGAWLQAGYAHQWPEAERVHALCDGFERHLAAAAPMPEGATA